MGTWGAGIFSNDTSADVRDEYRELVSEGRDGREATRALIEEYEDDVADPGVAPDVWLALAATQWKVGRLEEEVKARALELFTDPAGTRPIVGLLDWLGEKALPPAEELEALPFREQRVEGETVPAFYTLLSRAGEPPEDRIELLASGLPPVDPGIDDQVLYWADLGEEVEKRFGLRPEPADVDFYFFEYEVEAAARKAVEDLRALGFDAELGSSEADEGWCVDVDSGPGSERELALQRYADRTNARLCLP